MMLKHKCQSLPFHHDKDYESGTFSVRRESAICFRVKVDEGS